MAAAIAVVGIIIGVGTSIEAVVAALPREPAAEVTPQVEQAAITLIQHIRSLGTDLSDLKPALQFLDTHGRNVSPETGPAPVFGDEDISAAFIADETIRLIVQFIRDVT